LGAQYGGKSQDVSAEENKTTRRLTSADRTALGIGCAALVAGIPVLTLAHGIVLMAIGIFLLGLCAIAFVALAFLLVGESEDHHYRKGAL
jgi:type IV secretory pathway VirB3-like protein